MLFQTVTFAVFFSIVVAFYTATRGWQSRKFVLLVASYVFYMWWNPAFILLIVASTVIDFTVGRAMARADGNRRKQLLLVSLATNLGFLGFFKYAGFFQDNALRLASWFGQEPSWTELNVILPVGISFYTFQTLSYSIDVYRRTLDPVDNPLDFALFVSFFPQLVAGPIVRASEFLPQLDVPKSFSLRVDAILLILRGLVKKVLIADGIAQYVDAILSQPSTWPSIAIWLAMIGFYIQIYCDFSGYSDMAIGFARLLGFELPLNFDRPYFSVEPSEFWRRWHISLSGWLRDYLYIPLGGNRGSSLITYRNLFLTMVIGGFWHGAGWNFILWGAMHGVALMVHRGLSSVTDSAPRTPRIFRMLAFQFFIVLTWVPFRLPSFADAMVVFEKMLLFDFDISTSNLGLGRASLAIVSSAALMLVFAALHIVSWRRGGIDEMLGRRSSLHLGLAGCAVALVVAFMWPTADVPFLYFQF